MWEINVEMDEFCSFEKNEFEVGGRGVRGWVISVRGWVGRGVGWGGGVGGGGGDECR